MKHIMWPKTIQISTPVINEINWASKSSYLKLIRPNFAEFPINVICSVLYTNSWTGVMEYDMTNEAYNVFIIKQQVIHSVGLR